MAKVTRISFTKGDIFCLTTSLLGRPRLSEVVVLGSSRLPGEVQSVEDGFDFARRSCLALVFARLGTLIADIVLEVSLSDELLNLVLEGDAFFRGVADISVVSVVLILVPL